MEYENICFECGAPIDDEEDSYYDNTDGFERWFCCSTCYELYLDKFSGYEMVE